jgi:hypothetical protein
MFKYEIKTFGFKNNYTCILYKVLKDQLLEIKRNDYKTKTLNQAYNQFLNKLKTKSTTGG